MKTTLLRAATLPAVLLLVVYLAGMTWLGLFAPPAGAAPGIRVAFYTGVYPFIVPDLIKLTIAGTLVPGLWRLFGRQ